MQKITSNDAVVARRVRCAFFVVSMLFFLFFYYLLFIVELRRDLGHNSAKLTAINYDGKPCLVATKRQCTDARNAFLILFVNFNKKIILFEIELDELLSIALVAEDWKKIIKNNNQKIILYDS